MTETTPPIPSPRWPWIWLAIAMIWVAIVRIPLILNAEVHLDSDLAVDGLTLLDAMRGIWRWHFPGTPHMGTGPVVLAMPAAWIFGADAFTLVVGGVLAYEAVVVAVFVMAMRAFGPRVASWSLLPLACASVGTVWLSGRLTGGHLLTVAWLAGTLAVLHATIEKGKSWRSLVLGLWCGLGFWLDQMVLSALVPVVIAYAMFHDDEARLATRLLAFVMFVIGFGIGNLPREIGYRQDPYDSYRDQFNTIVTRHVGGPLDGQIDREKTLDLAISHTKLLVLECLPRLISGHLIVPPDFRAEPRPESLAGGRPELGGRAPTVVGMATLVVALPMFLWSSLAMVVQSVCGRRRASRAVVMVIVMTTGLVTVGFVMNKNIFNSDNYRYLVFWLVSWSIGFGFVMEWLWRRGAGGKVVTLAIAAILPIVMTLDTAAWYRGFGWLDGVRPVRVAVADPALTWLQDHPEQSAIFGGYWDVYRLSFLRGGAVRGLPFPNYPDRFDGAGEFPGRRPPLMIARPRELGGFYEHKAMEGGGRVLLRAPNLLIIDWPVAP